MDYLDLYHLLKRTVTYDCDVITVDADTSVSNLWFHSDHGRFLPGEAAYVCPTHQQVFDQPDPGLETGFQPGILDVQDSRVPENSGFRYHVFHQAREDRAKGVILLLHGLNEKYWHKYLPWAHRLVESTGKAVILFPTTFHMNRAPRQWSERRLMYKISELRIRSFPEVIACSLSNVAISTRLQSKPYRFFWSGLQTYYDIVKLLDQITAGRHPRVRPGASVDILAYSIGCLLAQILLITNPGDALADSRLCMFCGGAVLNRMSPVSRLILDSETDVALYSYAVEHLESHLRNYPRLRHHLGETHPEGVNFRAMLNYGHMRRERETQFRRLSSHLLAIALESDAVIPAYEVRNAVQGAGRDIPVPVEVLEFPYPNQHEDPFPTQESLRVPVDRAFCGVFDRIAAFYA